MNTKRQVLILLIIAFVVAAIPKDMILNTRNVTLISIDDHRLVVSRTVDGKTEQLRFTIQPETVRSGNLRPGARVAVHYVTRKHENIATSVQPLQ
jgi:hypothetical protein